MKKITRRNFMAMIAAIAMIFTLAGCQATPRVDVTYQPETKIINVGDGENFIANSVSYGITHDGYVQTDFTLINNTGNDIKFTDGDAHFDEESGINYVSVKAYFDEKYEKVDVSKGNGTGNLINESLGGADDDMIIENYVLSGSFYVLEPEDWNDMTLVFTMMVDGEPEEIHFDFAR